MIPDYQSLMRPVLAHAAHGEVRISDLIPALSAELGLSGNRCERPAVLRCFPLALFGELCVLVWSQALEQTVQHLLYMAAYVGDEDDQAPDNLTGSVDTPAPAIADLIIEF